MKIYSMLNCEVRVQLNGHKAWCLILEGCEEHIEQTFFGLYNLKGVGKRARLDWCDDARTVACVWTSEEQMFDFFCNQFELNHMMHLRYGLQEKARVFAQNCINQLKANTRPDFTLVGEFNPFWENDADVCDVSRATAEKPDSDMKDAILLHSQKDRGSVKEVEKLLGNA